NLAKTRRVSIIVPVEEKGPRSAIEPGPDDEYCDHTNDHGKGDRPAADADRACGLAYGFIMGDFTVALLVLLVGRAHRLVSAQVPAVVASSNLASIDDACPVPTSRLRHKAASAAQSAAAAAVMNSAPVLHL